MTKAGYFAMLVGIMIAAGCVSTATQGPPPFHVPSTTPNTAPSFTPTEPYHARPSKTPSASHSRLPLVPVGVRDWPVPSDKLTPGAVVACTIPRPSSERPSGSAWEIEKDQILANYDYTGPRGLTYLEFDHRVPFALCGANNVANIWPEKADGFTNGAFVHNRKDELEDAVIAAFHSGKIKTLHDAQAIFYGDWRVAWCTWVHDPGVAC